MVGAQSLSETWPLLDSFSRLMKSTVRRRSACVMQWSSCGWKSSGLIGNKARKGRPIQRGMCFCHGPGMRATGCKNCGAAHAASEGVSEVPLLLVDVRCSGRRSRHSMNPALNIKKSFRSMAGPRVATTLL